MDQKTVWNRWKPTLHINQKKDLKKTKSLRPNCKLRYKHFFVDYGILWIIEKDFSLLIFILHVWVELTRDRWYLTLYQKKDTFLVYSRRGSNFSGVRGRWWDSLQGSFILELQISNNQLYFWRIPQRFQQ